MDYSLNGPSENSITFKDQIIGEKEVETILELMKQNNVDRLELQGTTINLDAIRRIVNHEKFGKIRHLILPRNNLGQDGAILIAEVLKGNDRLSEINLSENKIGLLGVEAIAKVLKSTKITGIDLSRNKIDFAGAHAIANRLEDTRITRINLSHTNMEPKAFELIVNALKHSEITDIDLSYNSISDEAARSIARACKQLEKLNLHHTQISLDGFTAIIGALKNRPVTSLNVGGNEFENKTVGKIANVLKKSKISDLNLEKSNMTMEGLKSLTKALKGSSVRVLSLAGNDLKDGGAKMIAKVLNETAIVDLNLDDNEITEQGGQLIAKSLEASVLMKLTLKDNALLTKEFLVDMKKQVDENQRRVESMAGSFSELVVKGENDLDFIVVGELPEQSVTIFLTRTLSRNKKGWTKLLVSKYGRDYGEAEIEKFVNRVELKLEELLSGLKIDLPQRVKYLLECEEIGLKGVVKGLISKHRDNYLLRDEVPAQPHELDGILHPAVYIVLAKHSPNYVKKNLRKDKLKIFQNNNWDQFIKEDQLGKFVEDYGTAQLIKLIRRSYKYRI